MSQGTLDFTEHCFTPIHSMKGEGNSPLNGRYVPSGFEMTFSFGVKLVKSEFTKCKEIKMG